MEPEKITITVDEYKELLEKAKWLGYLEAAGVDNWEGVSLAHELFIEDEDANG